MMNEIQIEWLSPIAAGMGGLLFLLFIIVFLQGAQLRKLRHKYEAIMGESGVKGLDVVLSNVHEDIVKLQGMTERHHADIEQSKIALKKMKSRIGIQRYNAFAECGSDLSFSIAWLNEEQDGIVLTNIHGRDHSYVYAKPIENGQSTYSLSPEEKKAIALAGQK